MLLNNIENKQKLDDKINNPKVLDVNLIKEGAQYSFHWNRYKYALLIALVFSIGLVLELYFGLSWWKKQEIIHIDSLKKEIIQDSREVSEYKKGISEILNYRERTLAVDKLLKDHIYWSNFFDWLEQNTLSSVSFSDFSGDLSGEYSLSATAKTYADVSWQAKVLSEDSLTKSVLINTVSSNQSDSGEKTTEFNIDLVVNPSVFKK